VRRDIADALELRDPKVFVAGFDRPNLFIEVLRVSGDQDKLGRLLALARGGGPGIVYAATRKNVQKVVAALKGSGVEAVGYHAGMEDGERTSVQDRFVRGEARIIVATNAFGMGVDKADIRFVAHFDAPRSLEAYYQEIGRAGRDGGESFALLLFNFADVMMQRRMIDAGRPSRDLVETAWEAARRLRQGSVEELARECAVSASELSGAVRLLESAGHLERGRSREAQFAVMTPSVSAADLAVDFELLELRVARERQMLDRLVRFADTRGCRRHNLLRYFGDAEAPRECKACESCVGSRAPEPETVAAQKKSKAARTSPDAPEAPFDEQVFEKLRGLRTELARELHVPPYVIFHDATLRELARALPHDERSFLAVKGAGPSRWQRYGDRVVAITGAARPVLPPPEALPEAAQVVREVVEGPAPRQVSVRPAWREELEPPPGWLDAAPPVEESHERGERPRGAEELWSLCASGATLGEICAQLQRTSADVASQLADEARRGRSLDVSRLLGRDRVDAIRTAAAGAGGDLVAVRKRLPFTAALAEIRLALVARE
jgi:ATP-dependent DNA helicase RecQ